MMVLLFLVALAVGMVSLASASRRSQQQFSPATEALVPPLLLYNLWVLNWLAPATACLLLALAAFRQENGFLTQPARPDPYVAMMMSNQNTVAYLAGGPSQSEHNVLASTFEFTNRSRSLLNNGFTPFTKPNQ